MTVEQTLGSPAPADGPVSPTRSAPDATRHRLPLPPR